MFEHACRDSLRLAATRCDSTRTFHAYRKSSNRPSIMLNSTHMPIQCPRRKWLMYINSFVSENLLIWDY